MKKKTHNPETSEREAFLRFCEYVNNMEGDKDKFLSAARLSRDEKRPRQFTGVHLMKLACLLAVVLLGAVGAVCQALIGNAPGCVVVTLASTVISMLIGFTIIMD